MSTRSRTSWILVSGMSTRAKSYSAQLAQLQLHFVADRLALGLTFEAGRHDLHHRAQILHGLGAGLADRLRDLRGELLRGQLGRQVELENGDLLLFLLS